MLLLKCGPAESFLKGWLTIRGGVGKAAALPGSLTWK